MGVTKTDLFDEKQNRLALMAKTLGHPARIAILQYLCKENRCINTDLVQELGLAQATISRHLGELKNIGLIKGSIEGVSIHYCIDLEKWKEARELLDALFKDGIDFTCC